MLSEQDLKEMNQLPLFRTTDPETSAEAAEYIAPKLTELQERMLIAFSFPRTAITAAEYCVERYGEHPAESYRKRTHELLRAGKIVVVGKQGRARMFARCDQCQVGRMHHA